MYYFFISEPASPPPFSLSLSLNVDNIQRILLIKYSVVVFLNNHFIVGKLHELLLMNLIIGVKRVTTLFASLYI